MTPTEIAKMACDHNKCAQIDSIDGTSEEAKKMKFWYSKAKQYMQEKHPYGFTEKRVTLALIPTATYDPDDTTDYEYAYAMPSDCLVIDEIYNPNSTKAEDKIKYILQTNTTRDAVYILTNQEDAILIYTAGTDSFTNMRSMTFQLALSYVLAWLTWSLHGDPKLRDDNLNLSFGITGEAETKDSNEQHEDLEDFNGYADAMKVG
jgi:hypothetical protein